MTSSILQHSTASYLAIIVIGLFLIYQLACSKAQPQTMMEKFELILKMEKTVFVKGEPIRVVMVFHNTGTKTIKLDGIMPMRQSANPPCVVVTTPDGGRLQSYFDGIPKYLMTDAPIVVDPGKDIILIDADLRYFSGSIFPPGKIGHPGAFKEKLGKGKYQITGRFDPTPQTYWSQTKPLSFEIN